MKRLLSIFMVSAIVITSAVQAQATTTGDSTNSAAPAITTATTPAVTETTKTVEETVKSTTTEANAVKPAETTTTTTTVTTTEAKTPADAAAQPNALENILLMDLKDGRVVIQLLPGIAPNHVKRIKELTRQGFYDGVPFHRVIDGFMAQTGDPTGTGTGGSGQKINAEFNDEKHVRGTVSMARAADPNSADSQFFIMFDESTHLDGNYTAFGKVIEGMEFVDKVKKGTGANGMVSEPDKIIKLQVAADVKDVVIPGVNAPAATAPAAAEPAKQ